MTMDDVTELFNLFASEPTQLDPLEYGSGLSGIDEEAYLYYKYFSREGPSLSNFIGPNEIKKIWEYLHSDVSTFLRALTGTQYGIITPHAIFLFMINGVTNLFP